MQKTQTFLEYLDTLPNTIIGIGQNWDNVRGLTLEQLEKAAQLAKHEDIMFDSHFKPNSDGTYGARWHVYKKLSDIT